MDALFQDLKFVLRSLGRRPGFTAAVLLTLGLGIGANTAIFSVVNGVLLQPLPFPDADRLVTIDVMSTRGFYISTSITNYSDWQKQSRSFEAFGAYRGSGAVLTGLDRPQVVNSSQVLGEFFEVLGVDAQVGRTITATETEAGAIPIAVLSHGFWEGTLGSDPSVIGRTLNLDGEVFEVIGVMPAGFGFPAPSTDLYVPMGYFSDRLAWDDRGSSSGTRAIARLLPSVEMASAQTDLTRITTAIRESEDEEAAAPELLTLTERYVGSLRTPIWILMGAVAFVLLIACANVANLLLARGEGRQKEIALRSALGAKRHRVVRQLLTESLALGIAGGILGAAISVVALLAMEGALPNNLPGMLAGRVAIDRTVLGFTVMLSVVTGLLFGFIPALRSSSTDLASTLKEGGRSGSSSDRHRARAALVVGEIGLSLMLLTGAGLLIKSLDQLHRVDKGFDESNVLTMSVPLARAKYPEEEMWRGFNDELLQRVRALPGVRHASVSNIIPLGNSSWESSIAPEGVDVLDEDNRHSVLNTVAQFDYFDVMSIPILRGRGFTAADDATSPLVAVIDESMAEKFWPGEDPIGKRLTMETDPATDPGGVAVPVFRTVVGVAKHVRHYSLQATSRIEIYRPLAQSRGTWGFTPNLVVKTAGDPAPLVQAIRREVTAIDADQPVMLVQTMSDVVESQLATFSAMRGMLVIFGGLALLLAAIGIYGVMSYAVAQRVREFGIRMALGAGAGEVQRMVSGQGLRLTAVGLGIGMVGAIAVNQALKSLLFGVGSLEVMTLLAVSGILIAISSLAAYVPARRATRVDPATVLRED